MTMTPTTAATAASSRLEQGLNAWAARTHLSSPERERVQLALLGGWLGKNDPDAIDGFLEYLGGGQPSYECPRCGAVSHNPTDVAERYCGACHEWETP